MHRVLTNGDLKVGHWYIAESKAIYDNGARSAPIPLRVGIQGEVKYLGDRIWATDDNNQALEKYNIFGPLDFIQDIYDVEMNEAECGAEASVS